MHRTQKISNNFRVIKHKRQRKVRGIKRKRYFARSKKTNGYFPKRNP